VQGLPARIAKLERPVLNAGLLTPAPLKLFERRNAMKKPKMQIALGIALGAGIGAALGVAAGHIAIWLAVGVAIGVAIGGTLRSTPCAECEAIHKEHQANSQELRARSLRARS
jgi:hypothetical protein